MLRPANQTYRWKRWKDSCLLALFLLAAGYFCVRLPWLLSLPLMEAPDEVNHLWVVHFLCEHWRQPTAHEVAQAGKAALYGPLPPVGYLFNALLASFNHGHFFRLAARCGTLLGGLPTVFAAWAMGKEIFTRPLTRLALPLLVILHPQLVFTDAYTNTDGILISICAISTYLAVVAIKRGINIKLAVWLGFLLGWAALSKPNALTLLPSMLFAVFASCSIEKLGRARRLQIFAAFAGTFLGTCGFWYTRNFLEFDGDCLGTQTMNRIWQTNLVHSNGKAIMPGPQFPGLGWWRYLFFDFWGFFGFMNRYLWRPFYLAFLVICLASIGGQVAQISKTRRVAEPGAGLETAPAAVASLEVEAAIWRFFGLCAAINLAGAILCFAGWDLRSARPLSFHIGAVDLLPAPGRTAEARQRPSDSTNHRSHFAVRSQHYIWMDHLLLRSQLERDIATALYLRLDLIALFWPGLLPD